MISHQEVADHIFFKSDGYLVCLRFDLFMKQFALLGLASLLSISLLANRQRIDSLSSEIKKKLHDTLRVRVFYQLAKDYIHIDGDSSTRFANESIRLAKRTRNTKVEAEAYSVLGVNEKNRGNYEQALSWHLKGLKIKEANNDEYGMAICYNDIGVIYKTMGKFQDALASYRRSNELCRKIDLAKGISMTYNNIGTIYREKRMLDSALFYYQLGLKVAEKTGDSYSMSTCLSNVGDVYTDKQKHAEALTLFRRCLEIDKSNEDKTGIVISHSNIARTLGNLKRYDEAVRHSDSSIALAVTEGLRFERLNAYGMRTAVEEMKGNYAGALAFQRKVFALRDSFMNEETTTKISEIQTRYETEKKEQTIALQESQLSKKNYVIGGILIILVFSTLLSYSYYHRNRLKHQARLQEAIIHQQELATHAVIEAEERERKRIAGDLHDGVGQIMSAAKMNLSIMSSELSFSNEEQKLAFDKAMDLVDEGCREVRTVSHNIMPNALLKSGLTSAIREFVSKLDQRVIKVNLYSEGLNERIDNNTESVLYRIIQESVNNVIKHSGAETLDISLIKDEDGVSVTIEDNGKGFDTSDKDKFAGIGMRNIQSRVEYLKGTVEWDSAPGKGTVVAIHIPLQS
jgi:signal transduction histidine kinase